MRTATIARRIAVLLFMLTLGTNVFAASVAWEVIGDIGSTSSTSSFGERFTVGSSNIIVTSLGVFDHNGDGLVTFGGVPVGIFRESDGALLTSTFVLTTDSLVGHY